MTSNYSPERGQGDSHTKTWEMMRSGSGQAGAEAVRCEQQSSWVFFPFASFVPKGWRELLFMLRAHTQIHSLALFLSLTHTHTHTLSLSMTSNSQLPHLYLHPKHSPELHSPMAISTQFCQNQQVQNKASAQPAPYFALLKTATITHPVT